jgi:hypothetical protein
MLASKRCRTRVNNVKAKKTELTPIHNKAITRAKSSYLDWTRQLFRNVSSNDKKPVDAEKHINSTDNWVDNFLAIHFGVLRCAKQVREVLNLDKSFERHVKSVWIKYLECWKNKPVIGCFTHEQRGGLQLDKRKQIKRFEFFTQSQLEKYSLSLKSSSLKDRYEFRNKEYL